MDTFKWFNRTYHAWSDSLQCDKAEGRRGPREEHYPHVWDSEFFLWGPYMCWGYPNHKDDKVPPDDYLRDEVGKALEGIWWLRDYLPNATEEAKNLDFLKAYAQGYEEDE